MLIHTSTQAVSWGEAHFERGSRFQIIKLEAHHASLSLCTPTLLIQNSAHRAAVIKPALDHHQGFLSNFFPVYIWVTQKLSVCPLDIQDLFLLNSLCTKNVILADCILDSIIVFLSFNWEILEGRVKIAIHHNSLFLLIHKKSDTFCLKGFFFA